jgi:hypothetical protein
MYLKALSKALTDTYDIGLFFISVYYIFKQFRKEHIVTCPGFRDE